MWGRNNLAEIIGGGRIRRRGEGKHELCLDRSIATTNAIEEAVRSGRVLYVEVVLPDGSAIPITNKPRLTSEGLVCVVLHSRLNSLWEELWRSGKVVIVKFVVMR